MNIVEKIDRMRTERGWTAYRLSQETNISQQTVLNWFSNPNIVPSVSAIASVCEAFGITLAEFFSENELVEVSDDVKKLYHDWCLLSKDEQASIKAVMQSFIKRKSQK